MAMLSVWNRMQLPCQRGPNNAAAITIGTNSFGCNVCPSPGIKVNKMVVGVSTAKEKS